MSAERRILIAGNWKMNGLDADGGDLAGALAARMKGAPQPSEMLAFEMLVCPPFTLLSRIADVLSGSGIFLGGQDCHAKVNGAHTGDISAAMLRDVGCAAVIVGHSERRTDHGESDAQVKSKAEAAQAAGLMAVICIGETEQERDLGQTLEVNARQIVGSLPEGATAANTVVAYEPVWAIGTGRTPSADEVQEVHAFIRAEIAKKLGAKTAEGMRILYGGSMKPGNARELLGLADVDGGLIGGASLKSEDFWAIAESCL